MGQERTDPVIPKYEYYLYTWGGFYNDDNKKVHGFEPCEDGFYFDTKEERDFYLQTLQDACSKLGTDDACLVNQIAEGCSVRIKPCIHRVSEYKGERVHSICLWSWPQDVRVLRYHLEYKWYLGFNDYPFGEDVDYRDVKVIDEWITGAFDAIDET